MARKVKCMDFDETFKVTHEQRLVEPFDPAKYKGMKPVVKTYKAGRVDEILYSNRKKHFYDTDFGTYKLRPAQYKYFKKYLTNKNKCTD